MLHPIPQVAGVFTAVDTTGLVADERIVMPLADAPRRGRPKSTKRKKGWRDKRIAGLVKKRRMGRGGALGLMGERWVTSHLAFPYFAAES